MLYDAVLIVLILAQWYVIVYVTGLYAAALRRLVGGLALLGRFRQTGLVREGVGPDWP